MGLPASLLLTLVAITFVDITIVTTIIIITMSSR
jgi:hypothetical protein